MIGEEGVYAPKNETRSAVGWLDRFRPEEVIAKVPQEQWQDFMTGMTAIFQLVVEHEQPYVLIVPWRGAEPLRWALEVMAERVGARMPQVVELPLGSHVDVYNYKFMSGLKGQEKEAIVKAYMETVWEIRGKQPVAKAVLLDEAQSGQTFAQAIHHLGKFLRQCAGCEQVELVGIAAKDARKGTRKTSKGFVNLVRKGKTKVHVVSMAMPQIDRPHLLPLILSQDPSVRAQEARYERWELLEMMGNPQGEGVFKQMAKEALDDMGWPYVKVEG
ncbi:MAG: hypothetical protein AAB538_03310 [Patescibacteria group bacterium]